jgi:uncharacterized SAM-binding protein YcdF (DUF218 family)
MLACIGLCWVVVTLTPFTEWWVRLYAVSWSQPSGEILIVLGGESPREDGIIGRMTYWRSVYAVRAWHANHATRIIVCGDRGVAESMRDFMVAQRIPADAITMDLTSESTRQNALNAASILQNTPGRKILVTSDTHMWRALRTFRKIGLDVEPLTAPDGVWHSNELFTMDVFQRWSVFIQLMVETTKIAFYTAQGWI